MVRCLFATKLETAETMEGVALNMRAPYFYPTSIQKESHGHARPGDSEWESIHVHEAVREAGSGIDEAVSLSFEKARQVPAEMREEIRARGDAFRRRERACQRGGCR